MHWRTTLIFMVALWLSAPGVAPAAPAEGAPTINPRAEKILREALDYLEAARIFAFHAEENLDRVLPGGQKIMYSRSLDVTVRRPDRLRASYAGDLQQGEAWYDGKSFTLLDLNNRTYATCAAPGAIDGLVDDLKSKRGFRLPLSNLLRKDLAARSLEEVRGGSYLGLHSVGGTPCHHLAFTQDDMDWQVWVEEGTQPLVRKIVLSSKNRPGSPQREAVFSRWEFGPDPGDAFFAFHPPEGAVKADFLETGGK